MIKSFAWILINEAVKNYIIFTQGSLPDNSNKLGQLWRMDTQSSGESRGLSHWKEIKTVEQCLHMFGQFDISYICGRHETWVRSLYGQSRENWKQRLWGWVRMFVQHAYRRCSLMWTEGLDFKKNRINKDPSFTALQQPNNPSMKWNQLNCTRQQCLYTKSLHFSDQFTEGSRILSSFDFTHKSGSGTLPLCQGNHLCPNECP